MGYCCSRCGGLGGLFKSSHLHSDPDSCFAELAEEKKRLLLQVGELQKDKEALIEQRDKAYDAHNRKCQDVYEIETKLKDAERKGRDLCQQNGELLLDLSKANRFLGELQKTMSLIWSNAAHHRRCGEEKDPNGCVDLCPIKLASNALAEKLYTTAVGIRFCTCEPMTYQEGLDGNCIKCKRPMNKPNDEVCGKVHVWGACLRPKAHPGLCATV